MIQKEKVTADKKGAERKKEEVTGTIFEESKPEE